MCVASIINLKNNERALGDRSLETMLHATGYKS